MSTVITDAHAVAQRLRTLEGREFEGIVAEILNAFLTDHELVVVGGREKILRKAIGDPSTARELVNFTKLPVKRQCTQSQIEDYPDSDLFVLREPAAPGKQYRLLAIINCKVSFHGRHTETCFWGQAVRASSQIKYICVTEDRDTYSKRSELGQSCQRATAKRRLLECFTDRVYTIKRYPTRDSPLLDADIQQKRLLVAQTPDAVVFDDPSRMRHTEYCHLVRPFDELATDLIYWKRDVPG